MLDFAGKLTTRPENIGREDVDRLRRAGFSNEAIIHVVALTGYYNWANRIAIGLGLHADDSEALPPEDVPGISTEP